MRIPGKSWRSCSALVCGLVQHNAWDIHLSDTCDSLVLVLAQYPTDLVKKISFLIRKDD